MKQSFSPGQRVICVKQMNTPNRDHLRGYYGHVHSIVGQWVVVTLEGHTADADPTWPDARTHPFWPDELEHTD